MNYTIQLLDANLVYSHDSGIFGTCTLKLPVISVICTNSGILTHFHAALNFPIYHG